MEPPYDDFDDLCRWLAEFKELPVDGPITWRVLFYAWEPRCLQELAAQLVSKGYTNPIFDASVGKDCFSLAVDIAVGRTPEQMAQRAREFHALVKRDGEGQPWLQSVQILH